MTWAQRLKRVRGIEIGTCAACGGKVRVIASLEDPAVIGQILGHLASRELPAGSTPPYGAHQRAGSGSTEKSAEPVRAGIRGPPGWPAEPSSIRGARIQR